MKEHQRPAKLILTAQFQYDKRIQTFIDDNGLHADVLSLHSVPNKVLAALYHLASLSVTPTNFEGGFPFTFSEAYSVGTPSIMSRIPVVQEVIDDPELQDLMTFNPLDVDDIANKMILVWTTGNVYLRRSLVYTPNYPLAHGRSPQMIICLCLNLLQTSDYRMG